MVYFGLAILRRAAGGLANHVGTARFFKLRPWIAKRSKPNSRTTCSWLMKLVGRQVDFLDFPSHHILRHTKRFLEVVALALVLREFSIDFYESLPSGRA